MPLNIRTKLIRTFLFGIASLIFAAGIQSANAATLPLPIQTFVSGGTTIHVEVAFASGTGQHPTVCSSTGRTVKWVCSPGIFPQSLSGLLLRDTTGVAPWAETNS
jgi:hypothetical protein